MEHQLHYSEADKPRGLRGEAQLAGLITEQKEIKLFCVWSFSDVAADFIITGIFTKREDADARMAELPTKFKNCSTILSNTFDEIADQICRQRIGILADILFPKETAALDSYLRDKLAPPLDLAAGLQRV